MKTILELRAAAHEALDTIWFLQSITEIERTNKTLTIRLLINPTIFVQIFIGERSGSLYMALIEGDRRIFGVDREQGRWHQHPFLSPDQHISIPEGMEPSPLFRFLAQVEQLLIENDLL